MFDPSTMTPIDPRFAEWVIEYNSTPEAAIFYEIIAGLPDTGARKWLMEYQCLRSAYHAQLWPTEGSPLEIGRSFKSDADSFKDSLPEQRNAIARIRGPLSRNGPESHAAARAIQKLSEGGLVFTNKTGERQPYAKMLSELLAEYEVQLRETDKQLAGHNKGKARELSYMCIMWPEGRDIPENSTEPETALCFDLLCLLDRYSDGAGLNWQSKPQQPQDPQYAPAAKLTLLLRGESALPQEVRQLADRLRKFLKRNPDVKYTPWPTIKAKS